MLSLLTAALFAGHAFAEAAQPPPPPQAKSTRPSMTAPTALRQIRDGLKNAGIRGGDERFRHHLENITVTLAGFSYTEVDDVARWASQPRSRSFQYSGIPAFSVEFHSPFLPNAPTGYRTTISPRIWWDSERVEHARRFVEAVNAIRYYSSGRDLADDAPLFAGFQEEARAWRALPVKPASPEGVRRFQLLAEDAIKNKNFEEAVDYYEQGLQVSPLWPEGQFNAALLYGEMGIYGQAVIHMRRYLELKPDAPDMQAARDQVVIWQAKIK
jgi:tetratricopeptide (TPR) repeat protein